jgi:competence ComEA-like helix-hairpin-helix protein
MFDLTRQEKQVVLFLISIAFVGISINFLVKRYSSLKVIANLYQDFGRINLNSADKYLLISVPGIGEKLAKRIIEYREEQGRFNEIEELKQVKGMTDYRYDKLKDFFIVR